MLGNRWKIVPIIFFQACELCFIGCLQFWASAVWRRVLKLPALPVNMFFGVICAGILGFSVYDFESGRQNLQTVVFSMLKAYVLRTANEYSPPLHQLQARLQNTVDTAQVALQVMNEAKAFWNVFVVFFVLFAVSCLILLWKYRDACVSGMCVVDDVPEQTCNVGDTREDMELVILEGGREARGNGQQTTAVPSVFEMPDLPREGCDSVTRQGESVSLVLAAFHVLGGIHILAMLVFLLYPFERQLTLHSIRPFSYNLFVSLTHYESHLTRGQAKTLTANMRSFLPKGRYWLDNAQDPVFPAVHGDFAAFCAYNSETAECKSFVPTPSPSPLPRMPNVVLLVYESFNPSTYLIDDEFIDEHASLEPSDPRFLVTNTTYWSRTIMPNLREWSKRGVTFSGLTSHGLPTLSGWHSLVTGIIPSQTFMNIIEASPAHVDDVPSFLRNEGYRNLMIIPQNLGFDGIRNWVYRRSAQEEAMIRYRCREGYGELLDDPIQLALDDMPRMINCSTPEMRRKVEELTRQISYIELPKWFDYISSYQPGPRQAEVLGIEEDTLPGRGWAADRLTAQQFKLHWRQQREYLERTNQSSRPIFAMYISAESHTPYYGYDKQEFYDSRFNFSDAESVERKRELRFKRVNEYADRYYIRETLEYLKEHDPNTIVFLTGDHGTRDVPIRAKNSRITEKVVYSGDCVGTSSGSDALFGVTGTILYLGDDPEVKKVLKLEAIKGKTVKIPTDHNDMAFTIMETISRLRGHSMPPTCRRSRNLFDLSARMVKDIGRKGNEAVLRSIKESGWQSLSLLPLQMEYRNGTQVLKAHTGDVSGSHYYDVHSAPSCLKARNAPSRKTGGEKAEEMMNDGYRFLAHENFLVRSNRLFHYDFRNITCISKGHCPHPMPRSYSIDDSGFYSRAIKLPCYGAFLGLVIVGVTRFIILFWRFLLYNAVRLRHIFTSRSEETVLGGEQLQVDIESP